MFLQELQKAFDKRKAIVLSINLCSAEFVHGRSEESKELQAKLKDMNNHWDHLSTSLDEWRSSLQEALMQCQVSDVHRERDRAHRPPPAAHLLPPSDEQDFHEMSHGLLLWLENIDRRRNEVVPVDPIQDSDTLQEHHKVLTVNKCMTLLTFHISPR